MGEVLLAQFHQAYFEESLEGLEAMEAGLLALAGDGDGDGDGEWVHSVFRAAHSIKGGAATFGFSELAALTHEAESLLDELRGGRRALDLPLLELLLRTVDMLRAMFARARAAEPLADADSEQLRLALMACAKVGAAPVVTPAVATGADWRIRFAPHPTLLLGGNDPLRLLRELAVLGALTVNVEAAGLPPLAQLVAEHCHLAWTLELLGAPEAAVRAVFDWVEDECELTVEPLPAAPATRASTLPAPRGSREAPAESASVRVATGKIDGLIDLVGELMITQTMLDPFREGFDPQSVDAGHLELLQQGLTRLARQTRDLHEQVLGIRMLPIGSVFSRFPRLVRDLGAQLGKQVQLQLEGEHTELDKSVLEKIGDPLVHLVRNAVGHGLERPEVRLTAGKCAHGTLRLNAFHRGGSVVVEVADDGAGLNRAAITARAIERGLIDQSAAVSDEALAELVFQPGFSTAAATTDVSGRGVGMDVVRRNVMGLGGSVVLRSAPGRGSVCTLTLPLTLAIIDGLIASVGDERYIVPITAIVESVQVRAGAVHRMAGGGELFGFRGDMLSVIRLHRLLGCSGAQQAIERALMIVVESEAGRVGLLVDALLGQQQAVVKSLEAHYRRVEGVGGATILADGSVALILDIGGLVRLHGRRRAA